MNRKAHKNKITTTGVVCEMELYNMDGERIATTIFDKKFLKKVVEFKWCLNFYGYACAWIDEQKLVGLAQFVFGKKVGFVIDHINQNRLDNRLKNLRYLTQNQNLYNNRAAGIYFNKKKRKKQWVASIGKKKIFCATREEAEQIRKIKLAEFFQKIDENKSTQN